MKSKEALEYIKKVMVAENGRLSLYEKLNIKTIAKDLEVLEILKKLEWEVYENGGGDNWNWFVDNKQSMKITDKDAQLLKEWLEDGNDLQSI
mgnify:CR=1 FL=1